MPKAPKPREHQGYGDSANIRTEQPKSHVSGLFDEVTRHFLLFFLNAVYRKETFPSWKTQKAETGQPRSLPVTEALDAAASLGNRGAARAVAKGHGLRIPARPLPADPRGPPHLQLRVRERWAALCLAGPRNIRFQTLSFCGHKLYIIL